MAQRVNLEGALLHITAVSQTLELDDKRLYSVYHLGIDDTGEANDEIIFGQSNGAITAVYTAAAGKILVPNLVAIPVPAKSSRLDLITATGTVLALLCVSEKIPFSPIR